MCTAQTGKEANGFGNYAVKDGPEWSHFGREKSQIVTGTGRVKSGPNTLQVRRGQDTAGG